ncbi:MAG: glycerophosphodiester phosphodiesterase [Myxococcota bacterium]
MPRRSDLRAAFRERTAAGPGPLLLGHRGLNTVAPENTLAAFEAAVRQGADGVELDVRPCATGELVVMHDPTLARTGGGDPSRVAQLSRTALEARRLDGGHHIPTLDDVLALGRDLDMVVNIELKRDVPQRRQATTTLARRLHRHGLPPVVVVSSFDPLMLAAFRRQADHVPTALIVTSRLGAHLFARLGADAVHPSRELVSARVVARAHAQRRRVAVWTVNDPDEAAHLARLGVDAVITDDPARVRAAMTVSC